MTRVGTTRHKVILRVKVCNEIIVKVSVDDSCLTKSYTFSSNVIANCNINTSV